MNEINTYLSKVGLKVLNLEESEAFYDCIFDFIPLKKKENHEGELIYWSSFGVSLKQQDSVMHITPGSNRVGLTEFSIFVSDKILLDELYQKFTNENYNILVKPKSYDYAPGYYSFKVYDPDENTLEFYTTD